MSSAGPQDFSLLLDLGSNGALLALLLCGHTLGDFVFQTEEMVRRKHEEWRWLIYHALEVTLLQAICLLPFLSWTAIAVAVSLGLVHGTIDCFKTTLTRRSSQRMLHFWLDQFLHLSSLLLAWWLLLLARQSCVPMVSPHLAILTTVAVGVMAYAFNWNGGGAVVGILLRSFHLPADDTDDQEVHRTLRMGWMIGALERTLALTLVLAGQWGALGLILAAKSIARFKDLEKRHFGEYYLIGTLSSFLIAIASAILVEVLV